MPRHSGCAAPSWSSLQVRLAEAQARAAQESVARISHQTELLVGVVMLAVGLVGGVALARFR